VRRFQAVVLTKRERDGLRASNEKGRGHRVPRVVGLPVGLAVGGAGAGRRGPGRFARQDGTLGNVHDQRSLDRLAKEPTNEHLYSTCAECVYNTVNRESAIALRELGLKKVDALRQAGLDKRAEGRCFKNLLRERTPSFNMNYEIHYRYEKEGRQARLMDKFAQMFPRNDQEVARMLKSLCENLAMHDQLGDAVALAECCYREKPRQPEFMHVYADVLRRTNRHEEAREIHRQASTMPAEAGPAARHCRNSRWCTGSWPVRRLRRRNPRRRPLPRRPDFRRPSTTCRRS
jgi:hypothetical protein